MTVSIVHRLPIVVSHITILHCAVSRLDRRHCTTRHSMWSDGQTRRPNPIQEANQSRLQLTCLETSSALELNQLSSQHLKTTFIEALHLYSVIYPTLIVYRLLTPTLTRQRNPPRFGGPCCPAEGEHRKSRSTKVKKILSTKHGVSASPKEAVSLCVVHSMCYGTI